MKIIHELTLDVSRQGVQASVPITQHDTGTHVLLMHLRNGSKEIKLNSSLTATLYLSNDSYEIVTVYTENGAHPNTLECNVTPYMSSNVGEITAQLQIFEGADRVFSAPEFMLVVKEDRASRSTVAESTPFTAVVAAQQAAETSAAQAKAYAEAAQASKESAAIAAENASTVAAEKAAEVASTVAVEKASEAVGDVVKGYVSTNASNALKGAERGAIVAMDDVSPLEHKIPVRLGSKNLIPYPYPVSSQTINGVTFTINGDGTITANGTATADAKIVLLASWMPAAAAISMKKGVYYTLSGCPKGGGYGTYRLVYSSDPGGQDMNDLGDGVTRMCTEDAVPYEFYIYVGSGTTVNNLVFKPQFEIGATVTPFAVSVPDNTQVTVRSCGKNLFDIESVAQEIISRFPNSCSIEMFEGRRCLKAAGIYSTIVAPVVANPNIIRFNAYSLGYANSIFAITCTDGSANYVGATVGQWKEISYAYTNKAIKSLDFYCEASKDNAVYIDLNSFMVEKNTAPTAFEPYKEGETITTTIAEGAELTSISPNMTITTDTAGAVIDCTYNKDINKAIEKLTQAIISIGGII